MHSHHAAMRPHLTQRAMGYRHLYMQHHTYPPSRTSTRISRSFLLTSLLTEARCMCTRQQSRLDPYVSLIFDQKQTHLRHSWKRSCTRSRATILESQLSLHLEIKSISSSRPCIHQEPSTPIARKKSRRQQRMSTASLDDRSEILLDRKTISSQRETLETTPVPR